MSGKVGCAGIDKEGKMRVSWWKLLLPLGALVIVATALVSSSAAAPKAKEVRVAIMTDCQGAFAFALRG